MNMDYIADLKITIESAGCVSVNGEYFFACSHCGELTHEDRHTVVRHVELKTPARGLCDDCFDTEALAEEKVV